MPAKLTAAELRRRQDERNRRKRNYNKTHYTLVQAQLPKDLAEQLRRTLGRDGVSLPAFMKQAYETYAKQGGHTIQISQAMVSKYLPVGVSSKNITPYIIACMKFCIENDVAEELAEDFSG